MDELQWHAPTNNEMYNSLIVILLFLIFFSIFVRCVPYIGIRWRAWMSKRKRREGQAVLLADHIIEHLEEEVSKGFMKEEDQKWWLKLLQNSTPHELSQQFKPGVLTKVSPAWDVKEKIRQRLNLDDNNKKKPYLSKLNAIFARSR